MKKKHIALAVILILILSACGGRLPKPSRSQHIIQRYFKKYAKKYPATSYGQFKVKKVEIDSTKEIHKKLAAVDAYIVLGDGDLKKISVTLEKGPLGWRLTSWEDETSE